MYVFYIRSSNSEAFFSNSRFKNLWGRHGFLFALWAITKMICVLIYKYEFILDLDDNESKKPEYGTAGGLHTELRATNTLSTHILHTKKYQFLPYVRPLKKSTRGISARPHMPSAMGKVSAHDLDIWEWRPLQDLTHCLAGYGWLLSNQNLRRRTVIH